MALYGIFLVPWTSDWFSLARTFDPSPFGLDLCDELVALFDAMGKE
jgi:hypothetical protein